MPNFPSYSFLNDDDDHGQLLPLSGGNIICIYEDGTSNSLSSFIYDESTDTWDSSPTFITTITTNTVSPEDAWNNNANWGAVFDPATHNIYLLVNNDILNSTGDLETWVYFNNSQTWSQKSNVVTDIGSGGDEVKPIYDLASNTLFAVYIIGMDIFMKNSTDGGNTWGEATEVSTVNEAWIVLRTNFLTTERGYVIYFDNINNDVYGNTIADLPTLAGNATVRVNVYDLDNLNVSNAKVVLTNSYNQSLTWIQNTSDSGFTIFTNLPYAYYNITVEYQSSTNNSLSYLKILSNSSYCLNPTFIFNISISEYSDHNPPVIFSVFYENQSILFNNASTFFAEVWDEGSFLEVKLNLTVKMMVSFSISQLSAKAPAIICGRGKLV